MLGRYLKLRPSDVVFAYGERGKPGLAGSNLCFNYSASGSVAVMAFCIGTDIGIDVEEVRTIDQPLDIASRYFHPLEVRELAATSATERDVAFLRLWTCKEAVVKAAGLGLSMPLDSFCLTDFSSGNARLAHRPDATLDRSGNSATSRCRETTSPPWRTVARAARLHESPCARSTR